ncbi:MAG: Gfo/Idh/MocA family oxidoreductase [Caldilineaceae bacterium]|nr:Gfo/Idh/MocA family oxidoreductase [Caldilineaceae bacterium]
MANKLRVGVLGMTHDHIWGNLKDLNASDLGELVAAADPNEALLTKAKQEYHCPTVYDSYEELLEEESLDAVYIFGDNLTGAELAIMAAEAGLHVMIEKPMASTLDGAVRMLAAARTAGVSLMVNWPFAWWPQLQHAFTLIQAGEIGQLFQTKYRSAHAGPKELGCTPYFYNWLYDAELNGAGALMDYCCYGTALARYLLGQPSRVNGIMGHCLKDYITIDDNAVIVMQWPRAIAISEASWTQIGHLTSYHAMFYGSQGTLVVEPGNQGRLLLANQAHEDGIAIEVPPAPVGMRNATDYFLTRLSQGLPMEGLCSAEVSRDAQEILEAGILSAQEGKAISLPLSY